MKTVIAHGTFDILHYGHINYLEKAKSYGDKLIVLVTSDKYAKIYGKSPYFNEDIRLRMISALKIVDEAILRDSHMTPELLHKLNADILVTTENFFAEKLKDELQVIVIPRTKGISSSIIKKHLEKEEETKK